MNNTIFTILAAIGGKVDRVGSTPAEKKNTLVGDVTNIISAVIGVLGLVCVVVMVVGGINYMTSAGDTGKVKTAKNTILYGLIGLVVCVLAFAIVNWLIGAVLGQGAEETPAIFMIP